MPIPKIFRKKPVVSVVRLSGVIAAGARAGGLSDEKLAPILEKAFKKGKPRAVAFVINSPGGSPVQSALIGARIQRLSKKHDVKTFAFCEDVAASGGYWLAASTDEIYVDASSILGSIGVISAQFGFHEWMERHGIERRVHTAGEDKSMLDPFRAEKPQDVKRLKALQKEIHQNFIDHVKAGRDGQIDVSDDLFTGDVWIGAQAVSLGLADGVGHLVPKMQEIFGEDVKFVIHAPKMSALQKMGFGAQFDIVQSVEDRAIWAQFGL